MDPTTAAGTAREPEALTFAVDLVAVFLVVTSYISLVLLVTDRFDPMMALSLGGLATACLAGAVARFPRSRRILSGRDILLISLATFAFRANPFPWVLGGEGQG